MVRMKVAWSAGINHMWNEIEIQALYELVILE